MIQKKFTCEIKQAEGGKRLKFIASTPTYDRDGDSLDVAGWQIDNYMKNPVILLNHKYDELPIAKAVQINKNLMNNRLEVIAEFPADGIYPLADTVYKLAKEKFVNAVSVGFKGIDFENRTDAPGRIYKKQELYEISIVGVPANPEALQMAMSKGIISSIEKKIFEKSQDIGLENIPYYPKGSADTKNLKIDGKGVHYTPQKIIKFKKDSDKVLNIEGLEIKESDLNRLIDETIDQKLKEYGLD